MKSKRTDKLAQLLHAYGRDDSIRPSGHMDDRILTDGLTTMRSVRPALGTVCRSYGRIIMKSPLTRVAAVFVVVFVALSVLFPLPNGIVPGSVAWGDVLEAVHQQKTLIAIGHGTFTYNRKPKFVPPGHEALMDMMLKDEGDGHFSMTIPGEIYMSPLGYANLVYTDDGKLLAHVAYDRQTGTVTVLLHPTKAYIRYQASDSIQEAMQNFTAEGFLRQMYQSANGQNVGAKLVQGVQAQGYEVDDLHEHILENFNAAIVTFLLNIRQLKSCAWIDPATNLPIQIEAQGPLNPCVLSFFEESYLDCVYNDLSWGVAIDPNIFLPDIPADYKSINPLDSIQQAAWIGVLPMGLLGWRFWKKRKKRCVKND